ncbi:hypothetical protein [uncultured Thiodictyon sp.]|uniref:hypothetical protein n=1 Tax=uncultured Thiodictyon sp. TaxID=1846217 RepID=UPI0025EE71BD|nr:hypothetical protein [uncultured Thiodictyon sp.]
MPSKRAARAIKSGWTTGGSASGIPSSPGSTGAHYPVLCYSCAGPSDWTDREWQSTLHRQLAGHPVKILPAHISGGAQPAILAPLPRFRPTDAKPVAIGEPGLAD